MEKTNVMRLLDGRKLPYTPHTYSGVISGLEVAKLLNQDPARVFKTLVTVGASKQHYVFVIPVADELSLKKAAMAVFEKSIEMVKSKELLPLTGYIHGGCSPIGMKKNFPTVLHQTASEHDTILFSAGKIGFQVEMSPQDLQKLVPFQYADVIQ